MKFLWVTDPWATLDHARDTTLRLASEAIRQKHQSWWCDVHSIRYEEGKVLLTAAPLTEKVTLGEATTFEPENFHSIQYRTDPPVDLGYLHPLQLLALAAPTLVCNPIEVLFSQNEKLEATLLKGLMPPSVVSSQWEILARFGRAEGRVVLKPLHRAQSQGVELLSFQAESLEKSKKMLHDATHGFSTPVLLQKFLAGIGSGETRLWFLDGKLLASVKKLPVAGDFRVNMDQGSQLAPVKLTKTDLKIAGAVGKLLRSKKIRLAAVDLIDGFVTDFNFTSPGLIGPMEEVLGIELAKPIIRALGRSSGQKLRRGLGRGDGRGRRVEGKKR